MGNRNQATLFFTAAPKPDLDETAAAAAYAAAVAHLAALPDAPADASGYRLFWVRNGDIGHKDLGLEDHAVVGRHSACDIALASGAELSLRHLLVATASLADGTPALRILDLHASLPFYTDDGKPRRSIVATGPLVLRLGTYLFGGVPLSPRLDGGRLPAEMPRAVVTRADRPEEEPASGLETSSEISTMLPDEDDLYPSELRAETETPPETAGSPLVTRVTVVPKAAFLTDVVLPSSQTAFARLTLLREGHSASVDLPAADLEGGVLIGRSERCADGGLRRVLDGNISRVHALLLRDGEDVIAFDLCSTQGMYLDGRSIRRHRLSRAGGCLSLARTNPVMLCLHSPQDEPSGAHESSP